MYQALPAQTTFSDPNLVSSSQQCEQLKLKLSVNFSNKRILLMKSDLNSVCDKVKIMHSVFVCAL